MIVLRAAVMSFTSIIILFILTKLIGNKQISQLNLFDYINGITIGSIASEMAVSEDMEDFIQALIGMLIYGLFAMLLSIVTIKSIKARRFFSGRSVLLIENGKICKENLKKSRLDINDLLTQARCEGYFDISDIRYAIMENNGKLSFLPKSNKRPLNPYDLNLSPSPDGLLINIIIDGEILHDNLKESGRDEKWLQNELGRQKAGKISEIVLATVDEKGVLSIFHSTEKEHKKDIFE